MSSITGVRSPLLIALFAIVGTFGCHVSQPSTRPLPPEARMVDVGDHELFVRHSGQGADVVLLHGMGDSSCGWELIEPTLLEAGYRVTVWDALGAGRSAKPKDGDYSIQAHVDRLSSVLDSLDIERANVIGHSLGGSLALRLAEVAPHRVSSLFLIDPAAYREGAMSGRWLWDIPLLAEIVLALLPKRTLVNIGLNQNFHDRDAIPEWLRDTYLVEARREGALQAFIAQERDLIPEDPDAWEQAHATIDVPTMIVWGQEDALVPVAQGHRLASDISGARLIVLPEVGHSPQLEAAPEVLSVLLPFLDKHTSVSPSND